MRHERTTHSGLSFAWSLAFLLLALAAFIGSGFAVRMFPALTPWIGLVDGVPSFAALWLTYWAIVHSSAYLRPRNLWRELELVVTAFVLLCLSCWFRVVILSIGHGM
jgi:hypothetical protein